jgi:putative MATE family efflux protein
MKDLTQGNEAKLIFSFTMPMLIGNVFQQSYSVVDSMIVGRILGKTALAAVGASFPILFLVVALLIGVTIGFSVLISQYFGAKDMAGVRRTVDTAYVLIFFGSIIMTAAGLLLTGPILRMISTPAEIMPQAALFLRILFSGMVFMFGYNAISAILRGLGDSKTPLYFIMFSTALNAFLVMFFVMVCHWGIAGSAFATVLATASSFIAGIVYLRRHHEMLRPRLHGLEFDWAIFKKSLAIGLPAGIQQMLVAMGMMAVTRIVNGFGTDAIAAFTAAGRMDTFAVMPAMNLSAAISTFTGQNIGAGKMERVHNGLKVSMAMGTVISLATSAVMLLFGRQLMGFFTPDEAVIAIGWHYLAIVGGFYMVFSAMFVMGGVLRGAGDTLVPMLFSVLSLWLIRIPIAAWLSKSMGTDGIWWSSPVSWMVGLALTVIYYRAGRWKNRSMAGKPPVEENEDEPEWNCSNF